MPRSFWMRLLPVPGLRLYRCTLCGFQMLASKRRAHAAVRHPVTVTYVPQSAVGNGAPADRTPASAPVPAPQEERV
ncbi:hypothetical protein BH10PSE18_BH10PSE18_34230 [soil metagenome]